MTWDLARGRGGTALRLAVALSAAPAGAWTLAPCPDQEALTETLRKATLGAQVGSSNYSPHPFPQTDSGVIADLEYGFLEMAGAGDGPLPDERHIVKLMRSGEAVYSVYLMDDWTSGRCSPYGPSQHRFLVVISDAGGLELGRSVVDERGRLANGINWKEGYPRPLPVLELSEALVRLGRRGIAGQEAQHVAFGGLDAGACDQLRPCVAARSGADTYIVTPADEVYRIAPTSERISYTHLATAPGFPGNVLGDPERATRPLLTLGGDVMVRAEKVD